MAGIGIGVTQESRRQGSIIRNAAGFLTREAQAGVLGIGGSTVTNTYTTNAPVSFSGANFSIRDEQDIYALAREIAALTKREQAGKGFRR